MIELIIAGIGSMALAYLVFRGASRKRTRDHIRRRIMYYGGRDES